MSLRNVVGSKTYTESLATLSRRIRRSSRVDQVEPTTSSILFDRRLSDFMSGDLVSTISCVIFSATLSTIYDRRLCLHFMTGDFVSTICCRGFSATCSTFCDRRHGLHFATGDFIRLIFERCRLYCMLGLLSDFVYIL